MGKLGILGGMGPLATKVFYEDVIRHTQAGADNEQIDTLIVSHATIPDRTQLILSGSNGDELLEAVAPDLKLFEQFGASVIAVPCNTFHYYMDRVQALTDIPLLNMPHATMKHISEASPLVSRVCILGTLGTRQGRIYEDAAKQYSLDLVYPNDQTQEQLMDFIYSVKATNDPLCPAFNDIVRQVLDDGMLPVLACTELSSIILDEDISGSCVDAMAILVKESIVAAGYVYC